MENSKQPTFPINDETTTGQMGLTKREYFAGLAMQGMLANSTCRLNDLLSESAIKAYTTDSVKLADELLKQLSE